MGMKPASYLHKFRHVKPLYHRPQDELIEWTLKAHLRSQELLEAMAPRGEVLRRFCVSPRLIQERYFECPDVDEDWERHEVYHLTSTTPQGADLYSRNKFFSKRVGHVLKEIYPEAEILPDHLIHVTCTGYLSPSPVQQFFATAKMAPAITHAYHMGCYAALPSVRMGRALVESLEFKDVEILHTEMCSLHLASELHTPEQMVVQTLFADGHIAYRIGSRPQGRALKIHGVLEKLIPDSSDDMTWVPASHGMRMTLSKEVPQKIGVALEAFLEDLCRHTQRDWESVRREARFAIHPGGPRILEAAKTLLKLEEYQIAHSRDILFERGNMSSATLPHIWERILTSDIAPGTLVVSLAFGPGLTIFGALFEIEVT